jgi:putative transposase
VAAPVPLASPRQLRFAWLTELVRAIHADSRGTYGWRRVNAELVYGHGVIVNPKTVRKIMRLHGLHGLPGLSKRFRRKANIATTADLVERRFDRPAPDQLWVTDIERHEALPDRAVMERHRRRPVAAGRLKLRAA